MTSLDKKLKFIIPLIFFLFFSLIICYKIVFKNEVLFTGDNFDLLFPQKYFWVQEISSGRLPLWNPYILSGTPYFADLNLGTLAPTNLIYLFIAPIEKAASLLFVLEFFAIGYFTFLCARQYKLSLIASVISGVTFMCSGVILIYVTNLAIFNVVVFLPVIIFLLEKALESKNYRLLILCSLLFAFQILSGHPQLTFYSGLLLVFFSLYKRESKTNAET